MIDTCIVSKHRPRLAYTAGLFMELIKKYLGCMGFGSVAGFF